MPVISGGPRTDEIPIIDIYSYIFKDVDKVSDQVALVDGVTGREVTYGQFMKDISRVSSGLHDLGVSKGSIVAIFSPNSIEFAVVFFAVQRLGAIVTTINPTYTAREVRHQLEDSGAEWIFTLSSLSQTVEEAVRNNYTIKEIILFGDDGGRHRTYSEFLRRPIKALPVVNINPAEDVAIIPYSSGTTGLPKGVLITHTNVVAAVENFDQVSHIPNICLAYLPMYHIYGLIVLLIVSVGRRRKLVTLPRFQPEEFCATIQKFQLDTVYGVPPTIVFLAKSPIPDKYNLSSLKHIFSGAAPLGQETEEEIRVKYGARTAQGWGMTETTASGSLPVEESKPGSVGKVYNGTAFKMVDPDTGRICGVNEPGEMWYQGPNVMKGYHNNPEATAKCLTPDGWLKSGDIGYYDEDGFIYATDRLKELIKYKGFQVAPAELEALLLSHPDIADAAVIGIPNLEAGELPKGFIVLKHGHKATSDQIHKFIQESCARHKWLRGGIEFMETIPKSPSGKILRKELRKNISKL